MEQGETSELVRLGDTGKTVADANEDIRGHTVRSDSGEEIGKVEELLVDVAEKKVRFLVIASGGFLGIGKDKTFIPVDTIKSINPDDREVVIDRSREQIAGAPEYDPDLAVERSYYEGIYGYYGLSPYWNPGYAYPGYPLFSPIKEGEMDPRESRPTRPEHPL